MSNSAEPKGPVSSGRALRQEAAHTPGPWQIHSDHDPFYIVGDIDGPLENNELNFTGVANVCEWGKDEARHHANARLIAAAPELLSALQMIVRLRLYRDDDAAYRIAQDAYEAHHIARAAIAKATGAQS